MRVFFQPTDQFTFKLPAASLRSVVLCSLACLSLVLGCSSEPKGEEPVVIILQAPDATADASNDASKDATDPADMKDMAIDPDGCAARGLTATPFDSSGGASLGKVAGDFTVETTDGPWQLKNEWSGCDSYVFLNHHNSDQGNALWSTGSLIGLFSNAPLNTHFFFGGYADNASQVQPHLQSIQAKVNTAIGFIEPSKQAHWRKRVHYVSEPIQQSKGSLGLMLRGNLRVLFGFAVDRMQSFDDLGSLASIGRGGFVQDLNMAAFPPHYYNHQVALNREMAQATNVTTVSLFDNQLIKDNNGIHEATFPDAQTMASFNTMEIDVQARCGPSPQECGEWDYEAFIELCRDDACEQRDQIVLWITPYSRPGTRRWVADATPFLGLLREGGARKFRFGMLWNMNPNHMTVDFRLTSKADALTPTETIPAFEGGDFDAGYNEGRAPLSFTPPASVKRVELVALITGHGQTDGNNCAEWCNHQHLFTVNDSEPILRDFPNQAGQSLACAKQSAQGVVPGQYGNWTPGRAAWCPGQIVQPWRMDITDRVTPGMPNTLVYNGQFNNGPPQGGRIRMSSYIVYYE